MARKAGMTNSESQGRECRPLRQRDIGRFFVLRASTLGLLATFVLVRPPTMAAPSQPAPTSAPAASFVRPIDLEGLNRRVRELPARERELVAMYLEAARRTVLDVTDGCYPDPDFRTHCRNLAERAKGAAVLSSLTDCWPEEFRRHCRTEAVKLLREVASEFRRDPNFRYPWQAAFWSAEAGIAAWFLWDDLDPDLRATLAGLVAFQADRFIGVRPVTRVKNDTEAETVSWNSTISTLAVNMMPGHPHQRDWDRAAKTYLYNTLSVSRDLTDETFGDDGRAVKQWIVGANLYDDFGLENHDMFHIDYVFSAYRFHIQGLVLYWLAGRQPPLAFRHHARDVYDRVVLPCVNHEGFVVYVSDNDWKRFHSWTESPELHAYMALLEGHTLAAGLEERALRSAMRYWGSFPKGFQYDNAYVCGKPWTSRIADAVLLHAMSPVRPPDPLPEAEIDRRLAGTFEMPSASLLTHRDARGTFTSFCRSRDDAYVRFVAPTRETWLTLPLVSNYRGQVAGKPIVRSARVRSGRNDDAFWVVRRDEPAGAAEAFVSLPDGLAVHIERAPAGSLPAGGTVENSVGIEKPYRKLTASYQGGRADCEYAAAAWQLTDGSRGPAVPGNWLNLDGRFGLIFVTPNGAPPPALSLPKPGARDAVRARTPVSAGRSHLLAMIACPDRTPEETRALAGQSRIETVGDCMRCTIGGRVIVFNCGSAAARVASPRTTEPRAQASGPGAERAEIELPAGAVAAWLDGGRLTW